ncbi:hypothetical protein [Streptomyces sp. CC0208]|uniref:hypothetical protein n=1 Tax=Streptomyces sp. CC0208 TaxID=2306165 RepID=UPI0013C4F614|nr:hypothetical protein [Streptomyces sp. CC0208]
MRAHKHGTGAPRRRGPGAAGAVRMPGALALHADAGGAEPPFVGSGRPAAARALSSYDHCREEVRDRPGAQWPP